MTRLEPDDLKNADLPALDIVSVELAAFAPVSPSFEKIRTKCPREGARKKA